MKNNLAVPVSIIIAGLMIAGAVYFTKSVPSNANNQAAVANAVNQKKVGAPSPITKDDHVLGNPNAEITMFEYSDTECPFCKKFHATMVRLMDQYGKNGKIKWVYRHFPLDSIHSKTRKESEATECAAELGGEEAFWTYINRIYEITPANNGLDVAELPKIAEFAGIDVNNFNECLSSGRYAQKVENDFQDGLQAGVEGTPHTVIADKNGNLIPLSGALSYDQLVAGLESMLNETNK